MGPIEDWAADPDNEVRELPRKLQWLTAVVQCFSPPQPPQGNPDVLLLPFDPQISTPTPLCSQERLTAPAERVQHEIARLAERLDQLLGKGEHQRMFQTPLVTAHVIDDYVRDAGDAVTLAEGLDARVPGGLLAHSVLGELNRLIRAVNGADGGPTSLCSPSSGIPTGTMRMPPLGLRRTRIVPRKISQRISSWTSGQTSRGRMGARSSRRPTPTATCSSSVFAGEPREGNAGADDERRRRELNPLLRFCRPPPGRQAPAP